METSNGVNKIVGVITLGEEDLLLPHWQEKALEKLAINLKSQGLPPEAEAYTTVIIKLLGSSGVGFNDGDTATVAAKVLWQDGVKANKTNLFWDTYLHELLYP